MLGVLRDKMLGVVTGSDRDRRMLGVLWDKMLGVVSGSSRTLVANHPHQRYDDNQNANDNNNNDDRL